MSAVPRSAPPMSASEALALGTALAAGWRVSSTPTRFRHTSQDRPARPCNSNELRRGVWPLRAAAVRPDTDRDTVGT